MNPYTAYLEWMLENAAHSGQLTAAKMIERTAKEIKAQT